MTRIAVRSHSADAATTLAGHGIHPVLARILAARGVARPDELSTELIDLLPPAQLKGIDDAARYLADATAAGKRLLILADYDRDGHLEATKTPMAQRMFWRRPTLERLN